MGKSHHPCNIIVLWCILSIMPCWCNLGADKSMRCIPAERRALLQFKHSLTDPSNRLRSWVGDDCCNWAGIRCDNRTVHVIRLDLCNPHPFNWTRYDDNNRTSDPIYVKSALVGQEVNPSLLDLKHLKHLDLSSNNFSGSRIPNFLGSFLNLRYLNLSSSFFGGILPQHLGNLSALRSLDVNGDSGPDDSPDLSVENLDWVSHLSHLKYLDMSSVNLSLASNSLQAINLLPHLLELHLLGCGISGKLRSNSFANLTSIVVLDLSVNYFQGPLLNFVENMTSLQVLDLSENQFNGTIQNDLSHLCNLKELSFSSNRLQGEIHKLFENFSSYPCFKNNKLEKLSLFNNALSGYAPNWIAKLKNLRHLDLSMNSFVGPIPPSLCKLSSLRVLYLDQNKFNGPIPESLGQLSHLEVLYLSDNSFEGPIPPFLCKLSSLRYLRLDQNKFNEPIPESLGQLSHLEVLSLRNNSFEGPIPPFLCKLSSLRYLSLDQNKFNGPIPESLGQLSHLEVLFLHNNSFEGPIPPSLCKLSSLRVLYLDQNKFNGSIPESLGQLSHLADLDLSSNSFEGIITDFHFANLSSLKYLGLSSNSFSLEIRSDWIPPFQLDFIDLGSCKMGPDFPMWLQTQKNFYWLNISNANIIGSVPKWLFNFSFYSPSYNPQVVDLSSNQFHGKVPNFFSSTDVGTTSYFFLQHNNFEGPLPHFPSNAVAIDLSNNSVSGPIHENIGVMLPNLRFLFLSSNSLNGIIPHSLCQMKNLSILDLSMNDLSGSLPQCWSGLQALQVLDLSSTNISGIIPSSIGELVELEYLHLNENKIYGQIPLSLMNCTKLKVVDLGENKLSGSIPTWIGEYLINLKILILRQNNFNGTIPLELCHLTNLQVLDLSHNNISGTIPYCFGNFSGMEDQSLNHWGNYYNTDLNYDHFDKIEVVVKWEKLEYSKTLPLVTGLHMSNNNLVGEVPEELTTLVALRILDLSKNKLRGSIPEKIYEMTSLEYLYLDDNQLSGSIPQSMTALTYLSHLNLSYNNFSGKIPSGNQFSTFNDPSFFIGNPELCGAPLKSCADDSSVDIVMPKTDDNETIDMNWFYIGLASGHVVGFSGFCGVLLFKRTWALAYFQFLNVMKDWLLVMIEVNIARLKRKLDMNLVGG